MEKLLFDFIDISLLITAGLNFFLGLLIFFNGSKKKINVIYSLNIIAIISWVMAMFFYRSARSNEAGLFWCTFLYIFPTFIASSFLYFTYIFPSQREKPSEWKKIFIFLINIILVFMIATPKFIIREVNLRPGLEKEIIFTPYYWFYFFYISFYFTFGFYRLLKRYLSTRGIERIQIIYLLLGYSVATNLAFVTNLIMPWMGYFFLNWLGQIFTCIMVIFTSYAILRYRLMDIRIVARKTFIYIISAGFAYGVFYGLIWLYNNFFGGYFTGSAYVAGLVVAPVFVVCFIWFFNLLQRVANKYFFYTLYNYQQTITNLSQRLNYLNDLDEIINLIVETVKQSMQLDKASVLLAEKSGGLVRYKITRLVGFDEKEGISFLADKNFLIKYLNEKQKPLVREELFLLAKSLPSETSRKKFSELGNSMKNIGASVCLPLISNKKLIGIIVLGSKISGDAYTTEDLELLNMLAYQAGIAIDSARLYKEIQDFNKTLQQKIDEQTKDIRRAYESEKQSKEMIDKARVEDEALLSSIGDGVVAVDKKGKIMFMNSAAENMLLAKSSEAIGMPYEKLLSIENEKGEQVDKKKNPIYQAMAFKEKVIADASGSGSEIYCYKRSDGGKFPAAITASPVILAGETIGAVNVFRDITVERQIDKSKSEFVSLASHQLRTPLTAIKWYSEALIKNGGKMTAKQKRYLDQINHGNERMIKLINLMLNISRFEAGKIKMAPVTLDIKEMLGEIVEEQKFEMERKKQDFNFECEDNLPKLFTDADLFRLVFQNVISNAVKYTPEKGKVELKAYKKDSKIMFEVSDTGIGIPKNQQKRMFEKLFRADNAFAQSPEGNGLGLYAVKMTLENLGGRIWFESAEGKGTTFFVELPVAAAKKFATKTAAVV